MSFGEPDGFPFGGTADLRLPSGLRDELDAVPRGTNAVPEAARSGKLRESGGGTHRSDQGTFSAKVERDGSVSLKDAKNLRIGIGLPGPKAIGKGVTRWYHSDKGPDGQRGEKTLDGAVGTSIDARDGTQAVVVPGVRGSFDITDALMRRKGADPYAAKKLAFLDATRDERVQLGEKHREQQLQRTAQFMKQNLDRLWQRVPDARGRRTALFELWDEVVEAGAEAGDELVIEAGQAARKLVIGFIRARLPAGGPDAYTAAELTALNQRRQSRARFVPYE